MIFHETELKGAFLVDVEKREDHRGFRPHVFAREFEEHGLNPIGRQSNMSFNHKKGTLRGMHFQSLRRSRRNTFDALPAPFSTP